MRRRSGGREHTLRGWLRHCWRRIPPVSRLHRPLRSGLRRRVGRRAGFLAGCSSHGVGAPCRMMSCNVALVARAVALQDRWPLSPQLKHFRRRDYLANWLGFLLLVFMAIADEGGALGTETDSVRCTALVAGTWVSWCSCTEGASARRGC